MDQEKKNIVENNRETFFIYLLKIIIFCSMTGIPTDNINLSWMLIDIENLCKEISS